MPNRARVHVTFDEKRGGWKAEAEGSNRTVARGGKKTEVKKAAIETAKAAGYTSVVIHRKDGVIQEERTYPRSQDPHPPRG